MKRHDLVALALVLLPVSALAAEPASAAPREFAIRHVDVKEANAILRSLLDLRKTAVDEARNRLFISDDPERLDQAGALIKRLDVPAPRWRATIVADVAGTPVTVAELALDGSAASWASGGSGDQTQDRIVIEVQAEAQRQEEVQLGLQFTLVAGGNWGSQLLRRRESASQVMRDGDSKTLVTVTGPPEQLAVAKLVGSPAPVKALRLVVRRDAASSRDGGQKGVGTHSFRPTCLS